jgi:hypothetical protein
MLITVEVSLPVCGACRFSSLTESGVESRTLAEAEAVEMPCTTKRSA